MTTKTTTTFQTSDLTEIIYLMCHNREIARAIRDDDNRVIFHFDDGDGQCTCLMKEYVLGHDYASVNRMLIERQRALRLIKIS
jgi:hypothetical protein